MRLLPNGTLSTRPIGIISRIITIGGLLAWALAAPGAMAAGPPNPILFVTQVPVPDGFTTVTAVFGNHDPSIARTARGGDLYIRYPDGSLKNLTASAGFGSSGHQGAHSIAVREPSVYWDGTKAVFSMVVGAPDHYQQTSYFWQLYEITGLAKNDTPVITKVPNQPADFNNVSPLYGTDDRIIFTSDRTRTGDRYLYPQLDEYEEAPTTTGLWSLDPVTGDLFQMTHTPSGAFTPILDSFGRVIFTRWDHLQRDQQANLTGGTDNPKGIFNYSDESATATQGPPTEIFPELLIGEAGTSLTGANGIPTVGNTFNQFFPWQINEDGTHEETVNHVGRHELKGYLPPSINNDPNVHEFNPTPALRFNPNPISNFLQIREDPTHPGTYYGTDAPEFATDASGQILRMTGALGLTGDQMAITYLTDPSTAGVIPDGATPPAGDSGRYRNPLPLFDGEVIASYTSDVRAERNEGTRDAPIPRYAFRLKTLKPSGSYWVSDQLLTPGISKTVDYFDPNDDVTYSGELWELDPVEVRARPRPARLTEPLELPEKTVLNEESVDEGALREYLRQNDLALIVSRNVTTRDSADQQQPYNLKIAGTTTQTVGAPGKIYDVAYLQLFQGDQIRGLTGGSTTPHAGRRVLAQLMHDPKAQNPIDPAGPASSVKLGADGSMAAFVPARRAMTWQMTDPTGSPVVRERYWLTFQPGEIRVCTSCHGINTKDQAGHPAPTNEPDALRQILKFWKSSPSGSTSNQSGGSTSPTIPTTPPVVVPPVVIPIVPPVVVPASPAAPTTLTAKAGNGQVALTWSASSGATSYTVKRSTTSGGPYAPVSSPSTPGYTDTGVTNGTTYYYVVSATSAAGESPNSAEASALPTAPVPVPIIPTVPTPVTVTPTSTDPAAIALIGFTVDPGTVESYDRPRGTVTFSGVFEAGNATVTLTSSNPAIVMVPSSIIVFTTLSSRPFDIVTTSVTAPTSVTITATYAGVTKSTVLTVVPREGSAPNLPAGSTSNPPAGSTSNPPAGSTSNPPAGSTSNPPAGSTSNPPAGSTSNPPAGSTSNPPAGSTSNPPAGSTSNPSLPNLGNLASLNGYLPFPASDPWNSPIDNAPVDPNSSTLIASIGLTTGLHPDFGANYNGVPFGIPYEVVSGTQPRIPASFNYADQSDPGPYPIPLDAPIEGGPNSLGDRHVIVIDRDNWKDYEMRYAFPSGPVWAADSGAIFDLNTDAPRPAGWTAADASGLPIFPGLVRYDEVVGLGAIRHALRFTVKHTRRGYVAPARHFASPNADPSLPPMGMRVRLKASFDLSGFPASARVILQALKTYGMFLADNGNDWSLSGAPDARWSDGDLNTLKQVAGSNFEVVQMGTIVTQ